MYFRVDIVNKKCIRKSDRPGIHQEKLGLRQSTFNLKIGNLALITEERLDYNSENTTSIASRTYVVRHARKLER